MRLKALEALLICVQAVGNIVDFFAYGYIVINQATWSYTLDYA